MGVGIPGFGGRDPPGPGARAGFRGEVELYASTPPWPGGTEQKLISDGSRVAIGGRLVTVAVGVLRGEQMGALGGTDGVLVEQMVCWWNRWVC